MKLRLPVRHQRRHAEGREIAEDESGFGFVTRNIDIEVHEIALVLVDCWNTGWGPEPRAPEMGWLPEIWGCWEDHRRSKEIINNFIVPARAAAREAGMTVVHAPSPEVARKYALDERYRSKSPTPAPVEADWPPPEWVREMRLHRRWESRGKAWSDAYATWNGPHKDIAPPLKPGEDEFVVATGDELHAICKESRARYLLYAGFALNWCVLLRDYGWLGMCLPFGRYGYQGIILRDATGAVETHLTYQERGMQSAFEQWFEVQSAYTMSTADFVSSCNAVTDRMQAAV